MLVVVGLTLLVVLLEIVGVVEMFVVGMSALVVVVEGEMVEGI